MPFRYLKEVPRLARQFQDFMSGWDDASPVMIEHKRKIIYDMCRDLERFCDHRISKGAAELAAIIEKDLKLYKWKDRNDLKYDGEKLFHWDHIESMSQLRDRMISAHGSIDEIEQVILSADVAWIANIENVRLDQNGFRQTRLPSGLECYRRPEINIEWQT